MDKILVNIFIPILNLSYDVFIPLTSTVAEVTQLLSKAITELSDGRFFTTADTTLCSREDGTIFDINLFVGELALENGSRLMLI